MGIMALAAINALEGGMEGERRMGITALAAINTCEGRAAITAGSGGQPTPTATEPFSKFPPAYEANATISQKVAPSGPSA